jgi:methanogenic corrinoid protein MtbC1
LRTTGAVIDSKEENVKFQFPHKKFMEHFPRKKVNVISISALMTLAHLERKRYEAWLYGYKESALREATW